MTLTTAMTVLMALLGAVSLGIVIAYFIPARPRSYTDVRSVDEQLDHPRITQVDTDRAVLWIDLDPPRRTLRRPPAHLLVLDETPRSIPRPEVTRG